VLWMYMQLSCIKVKGGRRMWGAVSGADF